MNQTPHHKGTERLSILQDLATMVGLNGKAASELCRASAQAVGADACLLTLTSLTRQHLLGSHGLRHKVASFDRCFGDDCLESSFFEVLDLPGNIMSCHSPLVDGTADSFKSLIATPIFHKGTIVGEILFFYRTPHPPFTDADRRAILAEKRKAQAFLTSAAGG